MSPPLSRITSDERLPVQADVVVVAVDELQQRPLDYLTDERVTDRVIGFHEENAHVRGSRAGAPGRVCRLYSR